MALLKIFGIGSPKNSREAVDFLKRALDSKLGKMAYLWRAYGVLAYCYMEGIGVEKSPEKLREIVDAIKRLETCGYWDPFFMYAEWFNPNRKITDARVFDNPTLPPSRDISLFWLGEFEKVADEAKNSEFREKAYKCLIDYFSKEKGFENPDKVENLKKKLGGVGEAKKTDKQAVVL